MKATSLRNYHICILFLLLCLPALISACAGTTNLPYYELQEKGNLWVIRFDDGIRPRWTDDGYYSVIYNRPKANTLEQLGDMIINCNFTQNDIELFFTERKLPRELSLVNLTKLEQIVIPAGFMEISAQWQGTHFSVNYTSNEVCPILKTNAFVVKLYSEEMFWNALEEEYYQPYQDSAAAFTATQLGEIPAEELITHTGTRYLRYKSVTEIKNIYILERYTLADATVPASFTVFILENGIGSIISLSQPTDRPNLADLQVLGVIME